MIEKDGAVLISLVKTIKIDHAIMMIGDQK
jgi:hypothetical protein